MPDETEVDRAIVADEAPRSPDYLDIDELRRLAGDLTVGDVWLAENEAPGPENRRKAGMLSFWYAARRMGLVGRGAVFEDFLGRIRLADFEVVMGERGKGSADGVTSPDLPTSGE